MECSDLGSFHDHGVLTVQVQGVLRLRVPNDWSRLPRSLLRSLCEVCRLRR